MGLVRRWAIQRDYAGVKACLQDNGGLTEGAGVAVATLTGQDTLPRSKPVAISSGQDLRGAVRPILLKGVLRAACITEHLILSHDELG